MAANEVKKDLIGRRPAVAKRPASAGRRPREAVNLSTLK